MFMRWCYSTIEHGCANLARDILPASRRVELCKGVACGSALAAAAGFALQASECKAASDRDHTVKEIKVLESPAKPSRSPAGGVLQEYKKLPRTVQSLEPPKSGFFNKQIEVYGIPIRAHACVSDGALLVAADRLARMVRHLPAAVLDRLLQRGASFHVIGVDQGVSDLPEHQHMKGVPGGYTGEGQITLDQRARGMGGLHASCGEENLIDLDSDPRYDGRDILSHEFAHCIMDYGLPPALQAEIRATYERSVHCAGRWKREGGQVAYAGSNASEYFAELTMWYFGTHGEFVDRAACHPPPGPGGLAAYDPDGFGLLAKIFSGTHPCLHEAEPVPSRVSPLEREQFSKTEETVEVPLQFDNRDCGVAWSLFWLTPEGERLPYGKVEAQSTYCQQTFPGHVWVLQSASSPVELERKEVYYMAADGSGLASVAADTGCPARLMQHAPPTST